MKLSHQAKVQRSIAIRGALDAFEMPHVCRDRMHAKLMVEPFPSGSEITDKHSKKKLIRHAACTLAAENAFTFEEYADLRQRDLLG